MHNIFYTNKSKKDLKEIYSFIAEDNSYYADKVVETILGFINGLLSIFPMSGKEIKGTGDREIIEPTFKYRIIYEIKEDTVVIITIFKYKNL